MAVLELQHRSLNLNAYGLKLDAHTGDSSHTDRHKAIVRKIIETCETSGLEGVSEDDFDRVTLIRTPGQQVNYYVAVKMKLSSQ